MLKFIAKIFGSKSEKDIKNVRPMVDATLEESKKLLSISNDDLRAKTFEIQQEINSRLKVIDDQLAALHKSIADQPQLDLNEKEAIFFPPAGSGPYISQIRHRSKNDTTERSVILTRGEKDTIGYNITRSEKYVVPTEKLPVIDTTGSGDVFGAVFILEKTLGSSMEEAIRSANKWAGKNTTLNGVFEILS